MSNDATSDVTEGQMVPWAEYQRKQNELDRLCAKASRAVTMYEEEITTLRARLAAVERVVEAARGVLDPKRWSHRKLKAALAEYDAGKED